GAGRDEDAFSADFSSGDIARIDGALRFSREVLEAAGARRVLNTGLVTTHMQGSCRMGADPARSLVDTHAECHTVSRLFVGDGSTIPRTVSANPSLTIMALALRLADHLHDDPNGYLTDD